MSRADDLCRFLSNARHPGESFRAYRRRRAEANKSVEAALRGRMAHESTRAHVIEENKIDGQAQAQLASGALIRVGKPLVHRDKTLVALRTKGITYRVGVST